MKYTKIAFYFLIAIAVIVMAPRVTSAQVPATEHTGTSAGIAGVPATVNTGTSAGSPQVPATEHTGTSAGTPSAPATEHTGTSAGTVSSDSTSGGTVTSSGGGSGGGSSSGGRSHSRGTIGMVIPPLPSIASLTNNSGCEFITSYLKLGGDNSSSDVTKLQSFLKTEGMNVDVTGVFDEKTFEAVSAFQEKYLGDIMLPWGVTTPTGQVYYTTAKKINEIYCKKDFSLSSDKLAEITAYKTAIENGVNPASIGTSTGSENITSTSTSGENQVGTVAKTSIFTLIWNFLKRIFGR